MSNTSSNTSLTYYITEGLLVGTINGENINIPASSGGGAFSSLGYTKKPLINNVCFMDARAGWKSHAQISKDNRGGAIVIGIYNIQPFIVDGKKTRVNLKPTPGTQNIINQLGRSGAFQIHFKGKYGSDGCIIPDKDKDFEMLIEKLSKSSGGVLLVRKSQGSLVFCGKENIDNLDLI